MKKKKKQKDSDYFWHRKLALKVGILQFLTMFTQLRARPKKNYGDPVKRVKVCGKSVVILPHFWKYILFTEKITFSIQITIVPEMQIRYLLDSKAINISILHQMCLRKEEYVTCIYLPKVRSLLKIGFFKVHCYKKNQTTFSMDDISRKICVEKKSVFLAEILLFFQCEFYVLHIK